jgi:integrase
LRRLPGSRPCHNHSEEDRPAGSVRDHRADPHVDPRLALEGRRKQGKVPLPEPLPGATAPVDAARIVHGWVDSAGLDSSAYGTHSMRRTKAAQIYKKTGNLRAVQLLLGHTKLESTVRYLGIEVDDALSISEQVEL